MSGGHPPSPGAGDPSDPVGLVVDEVTGVAAAGPPAGGAAGSSTSSLVRQALRVGDEMVMVLDEAALRTGRDGGDGPDG